MSNCLPYAEKFFDGLELYEDKMIGHYYKSYIRSTVTAFIENETQDNAFDVYRTFLDAYQESLSGENEEFLDLLDLLREYEETAATLIDKQRDHYIHSVNVFITGLSIFAQNSNYRRAFYSAVPEDGFSKMYKTRDEEFFFRWGIAALFHDVGYPVEIVGNQINRFIRIVTDFDGADIKVRAALSYENFDEINSIKELVPGQVFAKAYLAANKDMGSQDPFAPLDLMANRIHMLLGTDLAATKDALNNFISVMAKAGFIDHGYFSALIVLKWYGYAMQKGGADGERFYWPVVDAATAILLHNWYRNGLMKAPFSLGSMNASDDPIAYLLILCDELQEWNRSARGILTRTFTLADTVNFSITDDYLAATYVTKKGHLPADFCTEKKELLGSVLNLKEIFPAGFDIDAESLDSFAAYRTTDQAEGPTELPRPLLRNAELLAIAIHANYNEKQLERNPGKELDYPDFSKLPDDLKYSNLRQARSMIEHLNACGYTLRKKGEPCAVHEFSIDEIEMMAELEHIAWMNERIFRGWVPGERDAGAKTTPYLVPYADLPEDAKELDRDAIRSIPILAERTGLAVYPIR